MIDALCDIAEKKFGLSAEKRQKLAQIASEDRTRITLPLTAAKLMEEEEVLTCLSELFGIPLQKTLPLEHLLDQFTDRISRQFLKKYHMVPLIREGESPVIAVNDPLITEPIDDLCARLGLSDITLVLSPGKVILFAVNLLYDRNTDQAQLLVEDMADEGFSIDPEQTADLLDDTSDAPVIRLVNHMISQAVKAGASDIHIEPYQDTLQVRHRIDGILYQMLTPPKGVQSALISRIKVMAGMDIAEKRVPQDGRAQVRIGNSEIDIRISTVPTGFGERLVMRLLNKSGTFLKLSEFGLSGANYKNLMRIIRQNSGIILVTGPTGSGKTTTLYAGLSEINAPDKSIITIEDPVEYNLTGIGQIQVNPKTGVTFAKGLRSIVRQDPDVILIGEIRDIETASIAIQSALTGHLVFSTLHTNDAAGAVTRLTDLGVEPYLTASSVHTIIAQRLVRVLCPRCRERHTLTEADIAPLNGNGNTLIGREIFRPVGCEECFNTGYSGRQPIFEILNLTDALKALIVKTSDANKIRELAMAQGMTTLRGDGLSKVLQGITSLEEVFRVTQE